MLDKEFLDKVCDQIISETILDDDAELLHTPFTLMYLLSVQHPPIPSYILRALTSHCKEVYSLNEQEIEYVCTKYMEEISDIIYKKELTHKEGLG